MSTSISTSSTSSSSPNFGIEIVDPANLRADTIASLAVRTTEIPKEVVRQLLFPQVRCEQDFSSDPLVALIVELVKASRTNEMAASKVSEESDQTISSSLAISLRWIFRGEKNLGEPLISRIVLKALMPLYLAAGQGRVGNGVVDTFCLVRSSCMIAELDRLTLSQDMAEWLKEDSRLNVDPFDSIPKSFRIALPRMADTFWNEIAAKSSGAMIAKKLPDAAKLSAEKHRDWWSLSGQLCCNRAQITIPAELFVGVIAWDKLLDHWHRVSGVLSGATVCNKKKIASISSAEHLDRNAKASAIAAKVTETQLNSPAINSPAINDTRKSRLVNDKRFVEIRSARDPHLSSNLDQMLQQCRNDQGVLSLIVVKKLGANVSAALQNWQSTFIEYMDTHGEATNVRGFISDDGELTLVFHDVDRAELTQWIRDSFGKFNNSNTDSSLATTVAQPLVAGVAMVIAPSRSFKIDQLIQAAWRCLDGASTQGAGAVKTIEVY